MTNKKETSILNVQPQSLEGEQAVLGSMLTNKEAVAKAIQWLSPEHFYKDAHSKIFSIMIALFHDSEPIDTISVVDKLKKNKELESVGGAYYITGLVEAVPTTANVESYAKRSEEHTSELQSHSFISYAVFCLKKKTLSVYYHNA